MVKALVGGVFFLTLLEEVISCEYPIVESIVIGGLVLLIAAAWSESEAEVPGPGARDQRGPFFFLLRPFRIAAVRLRRTGRTSTPPTLPSSAPR